jgi:hypothetical protein
MTETVSAIGFRRDDGVVVQGKPDVPNLDQYVRDYVDKRSVHNCMTVLEATVNGNTVKSLRINGRCATDRAERADDNASNIDVVYTFDHE